MKFTEAPYGTWKSPISAAAVAGGGLRLGFVTLDEGSIYWLEGRPQEGGRNVLVRRSRDGHTADVTPGEVNIRTRVHEYGGGAYAVAGGTVYFSNFADQRVYRLASEGVTPRAPADPEPITPPGPWFYADFDVDLRRRRLICVREDHTQSDAEAVTTLVTIPLTGDPSEGRVIASGSDFYSTPRLSPSGARLAWLSWRHPQMPWDGTELWVADVRPSGGLGQATCVAGSGSESIYQPGWSPDGTLYFVSDRDGWRRLYRHRDGAVEAVVAHPPAEAEFGRPQWLLGTSTWAFAGDSRIVVCYTRQGIWRLAIVDVPSGSLADVADDLEPLEWIAATPSDAFVIAGTSVMAPAVLKLDLEGGTREVLRSSSTVTLDRDYLSEPEPIEFPTHDGLTAHAFYYAPRNPDYAAPSGERPPAIVVSHGGPTTATRAVLDLHVQYWTSRGFAVADVNYGGSSGYGRAYRQRLNGRWGIVDVADTVNVARFLVTQERADVRRLIVRGGSAGGYTTLAVLTFHPGIFAVGASYYGVSDLEVLVRDTHKFESRYLDSLVGPYPATKDVYRARSPIHFVDRLACALILFQGLEDKIVPPNQSQMMADAVRAKGLPVVLLTFEGEQHGFRKAETIIRCLEAELSFYGAVFGFRPADRLESVPIDNLTRGAQE